MPVIAIVASAIGSQIGVAVLGEALGAGLAGAVGAGVGSGIAASAQGGDFGKGFLSGAIGYGVGQGIKEIVGSIGGAGVMGDVLGQDTMLAEQLDGFTGIGDITGESGWGDSIGSFGTAGFGESYNMPDIGYDDQFVSVDSASNPSIIGNDNPMVSTSGLPQTDISSVELPDTFDVDYGMPETPNQFTATNTTGSSANPFFDSVNTNYTTGKYSDWLEGISTDTSLDPSYESIGQDGIRQGAGIVLTPQATPVPGDIATGAQPKLDNIGTATAVQQSAAPMTPTATSSPQWGVSQVKPVQAPQSFMDKMKGMVSSSDEWLNKNLGLPKGSTALGALGVGSYLYNQYQTYKAEQIAKGMKPMSLEEYASANNPDPNRWKIAANDLAKSGRTGTLPVLTARMNQGITKDYYNNYLPNANQNWWNVNANLSNARMTNTANLSKPFYMSLGMNKGK